MAAVHPLSSFTELNLPATAPEAVLDTAVTLLDDIPGMFARLRIDGDLLSATDSGIFTGDRAFRYTDLNQQGLNAGINHLQGFVRMRRGKFLALSGGDSTDVVAHLFIFRLDSRPAEGPWGSNLIPTGRPNEIDGLVRVIALEHGLWHAGGLSLLGDVLAIPLEGNGQSRVIFLHMADPLNPTRLPMTIERPEFAKAGAAGFTRIPDGRFICLVWREDLSRKPVGRIDFYVSKSAELREGFEFRGTGSFPGFTTGETRDPQYQTIQLLWPNAAQPADSLRLYVIATENSSAAAPVVNGANTADLFELVLPMATIDSGSAPPSLITVGAPLAFHAAREYCNFDSASGIYIDPSGAGARLHLYAAYHWRVNRTVRFAEFAGTHSDGTTIDSLEEGWIELHELEEFRGRRLTLHGDRDALIEDYSKIVVQDGDFDRTVSSVRWQLPEGATYRLFRKKKFGGSKASDFLDLAGSGKVESIADLRPRKFGDTVCSSCFIERPE